MLRRIIIVLVLVIAGWFIYTRFIAKPQEPTPPPDRGSETTQQPSQPTDEPLPNTDGVKLFREGKYKDAARKLEQEMNEQKNPSILYYLALSYEQLKNNDKAVQAWQRMIDEFSNNALAGNAYYKLGILETDQDKRINYLQKATEEKYRTNESAYLAGAELGEYYFVSSLPEVEKLDKARTNFSLALRSKELSGERRKDIKQKLTRINQTLVFSPMVNPSDSISYTIKEGDNIGTISQKYKIPPGSDNPGQEYRGHIRRVNRMKTSNIWPGHTLKIITGRFSCVVDKSNFTLTLYLNGNFVKEYRVAVGSKDDPTPEGVFYVDGASKSVNPVWHKPPDKETGKVEIIPYGDPRNPLGTRWIGFKKKDDKTGTGYGIHGTTTPENIGKAVTNGCIRLVSEEIEELYDLLPDGAEIIIQE